MQTSCQEHTILDGTVPHGAGFALRKRLRSLAERAWHQTVTHYCPEPWHVATGSDRAGWPVRPGPRQQPIGKAKMATVPGY
jgi:hypothetical protein